MAKCFVRDVCTNDGIHQLTGRLTHDEHRITEVQNVAILELHQFLQAFPVQERAVRAVQIANKQIALNHDQFGVVAGYGFVGKVETVFEMAPDVELLCRDCNLLD